MHCTVGARTGVDAVNALVEVRGDAVRASSLTVSTTFEKRHDAVLRAVDNLMSMKPELQLHNFVELFANYEVGKGTIRQRRYYEMDRKGFCLLAMGFTGARALEWKIAYIDAFDRMEAALFANHQDQTDPVQYLETELDIERSRAVMNEVKMAVRLYGEAAGRHVWEISGKPVLPHMLTIDGAGNTAHPQVNDWFGRCAERVHGARTQMRALYSNFVADCGESGVEPLSMKSFSQQLDRLGLESRKSNGMWRLGIALR